MHHVICISIHTAKKELLRPENHVHHKVISCDLAHQSLLTLIEPIKTLRACS
jgi:hypothetical protein